MVAIKEGKSWSCIFYYIGSDSKRHRVHRRGFETKREALTYEIRQKPLLDSGKMADGKAPTLERVVQLYQEDCDGKRKATTIIDNAYKYRVISRDLGSKKIDKITANDIEKYSRKIHDEYAQNTYDTSYYALSKLFRFAKRQGFIQRNPMDDVERIRDLDSVKPEMVIWTMDEFNRFIKCVDNNELRIAFILFEYTGMRKGELLGLTWEKIDWQRRTIRINQQSNIKLHGEITTPKTRRSNRTITMSDYLNNVMAAKYNHDRELQGFSETWHIFGQKSLYTKNYMTRELDRAAKMAGVPRIRIHGFRHNHASMLINENCNVLAIANRLGDTVDTVLSTYAHLFPATDDDLVAKLDEMSNEKETQK